MPTKERICQKQYALPREGGHFCLICDRIEGKMAVSEKQLKDVLRSGNFIAPKDFVRAEKLANEHQKPFAAVLVEENLISDEHLGQLTADLLGAPFVNLREISIDPEVLRILPEVVARAQHAIVFERGKTGIKLALVDPANVALVSNLEKKAGENVEIYHATQRDVEAAFSHYRKEVGQAFHEILAEELGRSARKKGEEETAGVKIVDALLSYGYENRASDIHIEPQDEKIVIRFRIDGVLHDIAEIPKNLQDLVITRIKVLARLRTDEHRAPQDGKLTFQSSGQRVDVRVSIVPIIEGEKGVLRILAEGARQLTLEVLGFSAQDLAKTRDAVSRPHGMVLVTGPTGCGKTTTLYSIVKLLNSREVNIATIEDPVEYDIEGVNQIQVDAASGMTFAKGLRSIVRQDPNIIVVGEIRDAETADIAVNAALTGHLVLSTFHTNDAATALPRLSEMEIDAYLVASTVIVVVAQRLVRRICRRCVESFTVSAKDLEGKLPPELTPYLSETMRFFRGKGCRACGNTGFIGRIGIFEVLKISDAIRELILKHAPSNEIANLARKEGMTTMFEDGFHKAQGGITTIEEILRVTRI